MMPRTCNTASACSGPFRSRLHPDLIIFPPPVSNQYLSLSQRSKNLPIEKLVPQLAELLLVHYPDEKAEALEHLDFAIGEFREMKMQPSLERAFRHKEILGA